MPGVRRLLPFALLVGVALAPLPAEAQTGLEPAKPYDQVVLSGDVVVRRGEEVGEVVVLRGRVLVGGVVRGDVIVLSGRIEVTGQVSGSVINVRGPVTLGSSSHVGGDVLAGERVRLAEGALVDGDVRSDVTFALTGPIEALGEFIDVPPHQRQGGIHLLTRIAPHVGLVLLEIAAQKNAGESPRLPVGEHALHRLG